MSPSILALLMATGILPSWQFDPARITSLIRQLDAYRFGQREQAARDLIAAGPGAVSMLRQALRVSPNAEVTGRLHKVLAEIRFRSISPGPPTDGFQCTLRTPDEKVCKGASLPLDLEIVRWGEETVPVRAPVWWQVSAGDGPIDPLDCMGRPSDGEILVRPLAGQRALKRLFVVATDRRDAESANLRSQQGVVTRIDLTEFGEDLPAGLYELQARICIAPFRAMNREPVFSNTVRLTIEPRER